MSLRLPALTCASLLAVFLGRSAWAQPATQKMEEAFGRLEAGLNDVEQRKVITRTFDLWTALHSYDQATYDAYNSVTQAVKASPNQATVAQLTQFEDKIQNHKVRMERVKQRVTNIQLQVRDGNINIDDDVLRNLNQEHVGDLKQWLKPAVREKYRAKDPRFGKNLDGRALPAQQLAGAFDQRIDVLCQPSDFPPRPHDGLWLKLGELLVPRAQASVAWVCIAPCMGGDANQCIQCLVNVAPKAVQAWNDYQAQVNACGHCPWWSGAGCFARQGLCVFLAHEKFHLTLG